MGAKVVVAFIIAALSAAPLAVADQTARDPRANPINPEIQQLLSHASELRRNGRYLDAAGVLQRALEQAGDNQTLVGAIRKELDFNIPLLEAKLRFESGDIDGARHVLQWARTRNREYPERHRMLANLLTELDKPTASSGTSGADGQTVVREVRRRLTGFFSSNGRYPSGYPELNALLPPDQPPLDHFDVTRYISRNGGFVVELRSKTDPSNVLFIEHTGLLR